MKRLHRLIDFCAIIEYMSFGAFFNLKTDMVFHVASLFNG